MRKRWCQVSGIRCRCSDRRPGGTSLQPGAKGVCARDGRHYICGHDQRDKHREGAALIVALWVIIILSLLIGGFAYDMNIEAEITSFHRKRMKSEQVANAGVEWAKYLIEKSSEVGGEFAEVDLSEDMLDLLEPLSRGVTVTINREVGDGFFEVQLIPERGRRNVNQLEDEDWEELLDQSGVSEDLWPELIDCFTDWVDENDLHQLNGAESDDSFYKERNYETKNAPLDTVDELLLIKHFNHSVVFGGPNPDNPDEVYSGIAQSLTVWGDGKINVNSASAEVLMTLPGLDEFMVEDIIAGRAGDDGEMGTRDDGFETVDDVMSVIGATADAGAIRNLLTVSDIKFIRVVSMGEVNAVRSGIWSVLRVEDGSVKPVFWREEAMP